VLRCDPCSPDPEAIAAAAAAIAAGEVICFPAASLYGLGADARNPEAVKRVFALKRRSADRPVLVLIDALERLDELAVRVPPAARALIDRFWPGRLTLVFEAQPSVSRFLTAGTGRIGVRLPGHPVAAALVAAAKRPITGTSANISGEGGCRRVADLPAAIAAGVALILDAGELAGGAGSTVVDVSGARPKVLREGALPAAEIHGGNITTDGIVQD